MRIILIILIIILSTTFLVNCSPKPMGETDYNEIRDSIERGENPPAKPTPPGEREAPPPSDESGA